MNKTFKELYEDKELEERLNIQEKYSTFDLKEWMRFLYGFKNTDKVLDLGCGNGHQLFYFSPYFHKAIGVDNSEYLIQKAQYKKTELQIKKIDFVYADCNEFLIEDQKFDIIYSNFAFYYLDEIKVIKNIYNMLNPNGIIFIAGSPDENAPELIFLISKILNEKEIPLTYKKGFSDVRKYFRLFRKYFLSVQFYRFVNVIKFPNTKYFMEYLRNTSLLQSLNPEKRKVFLMESEKILNDLNISDLTKIVDVLRASNN